MKSWFRSCFWETHRERHTHIRFHILFHYGLAQDIDYSFPGGASGKEPTCQYRRHRRWGFDPGSGRSLEEGMATHCMPGESHGREAWRAAVHGVTKSWTRLQRLSTPVLYRRTLSFFHPVHNSLNLLISEFPIHPSPTHLPLGNQKAALCVSNTPFLIPLSYPLL